MHLKYFLLIFSFLTLFSVSQAQDLIQTNYRYSPLYLNPAQTGGFYGSIRAGANYRDQGKKLLYNGYETWQAFADMPVKFGFRKQDWIGVGIQAYGDKVADVFLKTTGALINLSYHYSIDKSQTRILSLGVQYGKIQKKFDDAASSWGTDSPIFPGTIDRDRTQDYNTSYSDFNLGFTYVQKMSEDQLLTIGFSAFHFIKPKFKGTVGENFVYPRFTLHAKQYWKMTSRIYIQPEIIASISDKALNIMPQFKTFYKLKANTRTKTYKDKVYLGIGYRLKDALQLMIGAEYKGYDFGISYDITTSSASELNSHQGALELGLFKIINIPKKPQVKPAIFCPRL